MASTREELRQLLKDVARAAEESLAQARGGSAPVRVGLFGPTSPEREQTEAALPYAKLHWLAVAALELFSYPEVEALELPREMEADALTAAVILRHGLLNGWPLDDYFDAAQRLGLVLAAVTARPGQVRTDRAPYPPSLVRENRFGSGSSSPHGADEFLLDESDANPDAYVAAISALPGHSTTGDDD